LPTAENHEQALKENPELAPEIGKKGSFRNVGAALFIVLFFYK
jgi:hypothetical protein